MVSYNLERPNEGTSFDIILSYMRNTSYTLLWATQNNAFWMIKVIAISHLFLHLLTLFSWNGIVEIQFSVERCIDECEVRADDLIKRAYYGQLFLFLFFFFDEFDTRAIFACQHVLFDGRYLRLRSERADIGWPSVFCRYIWGVGVGRLYHDQRTLVVVCTCALCGSRMVPRLACLAVGRLREFR